MGDIGVDINSVHNVDPIPIQPITIAAVHNIDPITIADVQKIAPAAVHIKEVNQIAPLLVESLRVDHVRHVDPLRVDRFNVTHLPTVNLSLSQLPSLDLNVRRVPPVAIALGQQFQLSSDYIVHTRLLGFEILRLEIGGRTKIIPQDCAQREQSRTHERSFPDIAAVGNPAIPTKATETCVEAVTRAAPSRWPPARSSRAPTDSESGCAGARRAALSVGAPRFHYSIDGSRQTGTSTNSAVSFGG